ncbi:MAG: DNA helicase RecQ, partial [Verrucomicrobiae bacterium]|nr:DNA helicase RecQ [Verrucomicrobiae bacterium]
IALMKDQVDQLKAAGVAATYLNSTLGAKEARARLAGLHQGKYKLLYAAPERLMLEGWQENLKAWGVSCLAIDEAHCISEWGHDFRPEFRQIARLRAVLPDVPLMALTATATERVRADIVTHLKLRDPVTFVASFNRPNLTYRVTPKDQPLKQIITFIRKREDESGIIYCASRAAAERVADSLAGRGFSARAYHAGLSGGERETNQEQFLRDDTRIICATIAFGMGINKPNVRFVIHHDLPKNVEGYYQETGRAGRDGLPGECVLLYSSADVIKQRRFIEEKPDEAERRIATEQLQTMVHYAECAECRRVTLLDYFGEEYASDNCGSCDNCLNPRATFDGTVSAQKLLSCVFRIRQKSGFSVGLNHVVAVLTGSDSEKVRQWGHQELTTFGIGKEHSRTEWAAFARELMRQGLLAQNAGGFPTLEVTPEGMAALKDRRRITLTRPRDAAQPSSGRPATIACDEVLFEKLRQLRKELADREGVPPYIVFGDLSLRSMARSYPATEAEFGAISGVGATKLRNYGAPFLEEIRAHLQTNPRQLFADDPGLVSPVASRKSRGELLTDTVRESLRRFRAGEDVAAIAKARGLTPGTVSGHLASALEAGEAMDPGQLFTPAESAAMHAAFEKAGWTTLSGAHGVLGGRVDYGTLRLYRAFHLAANR